eukprot:TRINITY_DN2935_c0_g7_i1.p7 TRINITY_DN2935_c0_g7~~TRINITY_DN2935_c0_g7_i1.p7  ORF type:complete len:102 (-),score=6.69 TRINITY_DN2935_c0_g7_i1:841-1146(-)
MCIRDRYQRRVHGKHVLPDPEAFAEAPGYVGEAHAVPKHLAPRNLDGPVPVPDRDEFVDAKPHQFLVGDERIGPDTPPGIRIEHAGKKLHDRVDIRRDVVA